MANEILSSTTSSDQEKFLAAKLIQRAFLKMVSLSLCDKLDQPRGTGLTANFVRYARMNVPLVPLTEGTDPANSTFSLETVTVTLDQWGDVITLTDVTQLTTKHPVLQEATNLLADNAQRVIDREVQLVWLAGTNVQYFDGSRTTRRTILSSEVMNDDVIHKARVTLVNDGAPPRGGPSNYQVASAEGAKSINQGLAYVGVCNAAVMSDIMKASTSLGTWASVAMYANQKALYNSEVGTWLNVRWVESNFIPVFKLLGNATAAVISGAAFGTDTPVVTAVDGGGSLKSSTTFFYKVTRKSLTRGFEEDISIAHSTASAATGDNESFTFDFSSLTAGFVYNLYFDTVSTGGTGTDATLKLVSANITVGTTVTVTAVQATGANPPDNIKESTGPTAVHPVFLHGNEATNWVGLQNLEMMITKDESIIGNVLRLRRAVGYKYLGKAMVRDQKRLLRVEVASKYL